MNEAKAATLKKKVVGTSARKLNAREIAVIRYVWNLKPEERALLNVCFGRQMTPAEFADALSEGTGKLMLHPNLYHVIWCSDMIDLKENSVLHLSYRANYPTNLRVVLVRIQNGSC